MRLSSKNRKPRSRKAFACLCLAGGLMFLGMVFGLSRYSDMQSCEHRMNELIDFVKEQSSAYVQYNETAAPVFAVTRPRFFAKHRRAAAPSCAPAMPPARPDSARTSAA